jgi:hypothetical protein
VTEKVTHLCHNCVDNNITHFLHFNLWKMERLLPHFCHHCLTKKTVTVLCQMSFWKSDEKVELIYPFPQYFVDKLKCRKYQIIVIDIFVSSVTVFSHFSVVFLSTDCCHKKPTCHIFSQVCVIFSVIGVFSY